MEKCEKEGEGKSIGKQPAHNQFSLSFQSEEGIPPSPLLRPLFDGGNMKAISFPTQLEINRE